MYVKFYGFLQKFSVKISKKLINSLKPCLFLINKSTKMWKFENKTQRFHSINA